MTRQISFNPKCGDAENQKNHMIIKTCKLCNANEHISKNYEQRHLSVV